MKTQQEMFVKWPVLWRTICEMSYHRSFLTDEIVVPIENYEVLEKYKNINPHEFYTLTLDYMWKQYSVRRDINGNFIEPQIVPELKYLFVPRILFDSLGIRSWFQFSFPNCKVQFWEDVMGDNIV
jgi:hypothetical protein